MKMRVVLFSTVFMVVSVFLFTQSAGAVGEGNFSLQVSPSPLVATVKPGESHNLELKIRNTSTATESLRMDLQAFRFDSKTGEVTIDENKQPEIAPWLTIASPRFTVGSGQTFTQNIRIALPAQSGFSYSFVLRISRANKAAPATNGRQLVGSVAVFGLINVDRQGATKKLNIVSFKPSKTLYEYVPVDFKIRIKNTGNTILQPYGNVYIQRDSKSQKPDGTLAVNDKQAYLLPGTERTLSASWEDGFPSNTGMPADGSSRRTLEWNIQKIGDIRFGSYDAKLVAVYNDGHRDVPITAQTQFWVIPWKAILFLLIIIVGFVLLIRWIIRSRTNKAVKKALEARKEA